MSPNPLRSLPALLLAWCFGQLSAADPAGCAGLSSDHSTAIANADLHLAGDPLTSLCHAKQAFDLAIEQGDQRQELIALMRISAAELKLGMNQAFLNTTLKALELARGAADSAVRADLLRDLSIAYRINFQFDRAVIEARNSLQIHYTLKDPTAIAEAERHLMFTLLEAGRHTEALSNSSKAITACRAGSDPMCEAKVHELIARILIDNGKFADALPFLTKAEKILRSDGSTSDRFQLSVDRCQAMIGLGLSHFAERSLDEAKQQITALNDAQHTATLLDLEYRLALLQEDWKLALQHLQHAKAHGDSLYAARMNLKMAGLQVLHDVKRKEFDNAQLRELTERQAVTIQDQLSNNRYLSILLGGVLVLLAAVFVISRYTRKVMKRLARKNEVIRRQNADIQSKVLELKRQNLRLAESLMSEEEKEMILKEIHHRVKNNLQVVDSLLNMQGDQVKDPAAVRVLREAQGRIRSMAMVHEHIYRSTGDRNASLRTHVEKLARSIVVAHGVHDRISIGVDTDLPPFPVETLLPLSLMLNELVTNSIKHAFGGMNAGNIRIAIKHEGDRYELRYSDDGKGLDGTSEFCRERSFGCELIDVLAQQLNGELKLVRTNGISLTLSFMPDKELMRKAG